MNSSNVNGLQFLYTYPFNNGYLKTSGIDFNADYAMDFMNGNMVWHLLGNYNDEETETEFRRLRRPLGSRRNSIMPAA